MEIELYTPIKTEENFSGLTLLSADEYREAKEQIRNSTHCGWWLRSPGSYDYFASCVLGDEDSVDYWTVYDDSLLLRPVLILDPSSSKLAVGDQFAYQNYRWTVISSRYALCDEGICYIAFRKNTAADNANDYETSDAKQYLDNLWQKWSSEE